MVKQNIWRAYQDMILTIIEDKPRYDIPLIVYKGILVVSFCQIIIYLFSDFSLINVDEFKLQSAFSIADMVSIVNIINLKGSDTLSYIIYAIAMAFMIFYFVYVAFLAISKEYLKDFYSQYSHIFMRINEILNLYFTLYLNVFLSLYLEINCSLLFCSKKSMLSNMRYQYFDTSITTCTIPTYQVVMGIIGLFLTILTALVTNYYFRNYEFLEKNILKRKSTILYLLLMVLRIVITFVEFQWQTQQTQQTKHVIAQAFGVVSILDYFLSLPFTDQEISKFYLKIIATYEAVVTCCNFFLLGRYMNGQEMFYISILLSIIFQAFLEQSLNYMYDRIMQGSWKLEKNIPNLDYYLEQIVSLGQQSPYKEEAKVLLLKLYKLHRSGCVIHSCICHQYVQLNMSMNSEKQFFSMFASESSQSDPSDAFENEINLRLLYKFIDGLFQWMFSQKCINQSTTQFEKLSLKYISFMMKFQNNPVRAYYQLKILQLKKSSFSLYFDMVSKIVSRNIQHDIEMSIEEELKEGGDKYLGKDNDYMQSKKKNARKNKKQASMQNDLTVDVIVEVESMSQKYLAIFLKIMEQKIELWTSMQNGYKKMNDLQKDALKLMDMVSKTRQKFQRQIKKITQELPEIENCIQYQKLVQIYYLFIVNDTLKAVQVDLKINELKKRDSLSDYDSLKNISLLRGEICILEISLSENFGKIVSNKSDKTAQFFGFKEKQDFVKVNHINELMPDFVGKIHNQLMKNYLHGNSARAKNGNSTIYSFMKQKDGYIFPIKIHFDFNFSTISNEFRMNGILLKSQAEKEYIIFHRSGRIVGISKNLAKVLYFDSSSLPSGDIVINRMNALLLFPRLIKKLIQHKDQILNDLQRKLTSDAQTIGESSEKVTAFQKSACTNTTLMEDQKSIARFTANPAKNLRRFMSYLNKKAAIQGFLRYNELDLMQQKCLMILKQFDEQDYGGQSTGRSNLSSDRFNSSRGRGEDNFFNDGQKYKTITTQGTKNSTQPMELKMIFEYSIQYCLLDQREKKVISQLKQEKSYLTANKYIKNKNGNENGTKQKKDKLQDIYFTVCFENIQIATRQKKIKTKKRNNIFTNLFAYLRSTTSVIPLAQNIEKLSLLKQQYSSLLDTQDELQLDSQQNQKISNVSTQILENLAPPLSTSGYEDWIHMPKKMLKDLQYSFFSTGNYEEDLYKQKSQEHKKKKSQYDLEEDDQQLGLYSSSNRTSNSEDQDSDQSDDEDINYEKLHAVIVNQAHSNKETKDGWDATYPQLEQTINGYCVQKNVLNTVDPNYPVKKILQNRSMSSAFGKALELAIAEALVQIEIEKKYAKTNVLQNQETAGYDQLLYSRINKEDVIQPVTFRKGINPQDQNVSFDKPQSSLNNIQQNDSGFNPQIQVTQPQKRKSNIRESQLDVSQISDLNNYNPVQEFDISNRASFLAMEQSNVLATSFLSNYPPQQGQLKSQMENQTKNYLDVSARPILDQTGYNHYYDVENGRVNTPSVMDIIDLNQTATKPQIESYQDKKQLSNQSYKRVSIEDFKQPQTQFLSITQQSRGRFENEYQLSHTQLSVQQQQQQKNNQMYVKNEKSQDQYISIRNSSDKQAQDNSNEQEIMHDQAIAKILNQKGMLNGKNTIQKGSVHSSSRSSSSYAGVFLREIILRCKIPTAAQRYKVLLVFFLAAFIGLTLTNLMVIQSDMQIFSNNVIVLRQPRRFLRAYGKALFGYYMQIQLDMGYLIDTSDKQYLQYSEDYINKGVSEYNSLCEQYSIQLIELAQQQFAGQDEEETLSQYYIYKFRQQSTLNLTKILMYPQNQYQILTLSSKNTPSDRIDSFLYLRQNYFAFSQNVIDQVSFLVDNTISAVNSLIFKFTVVIIAAISGVILIALVSLPIIREVNLYEEKIMMILTRINFDQSEMEKTKLAICKQLINIEMIDWLNYSYFDIFSLTWQNQESLSGSYNPKNNSIGGGNLLKSIRDKDKETKLNHSKVKEIQPLNPVEQSSVLNLKQNQDPQSMQDHFFQSYKTDAKMQAIDYKIKINNQSDMRLTDKIRGAKKILKNEGVINSQNGSSNTNYLLQSKMIVQTLTIFDRFLTIFSLTVINCIYFIVIIIYLTSSNDQLKVPVQMNQRSINLHIIQTNLKIATALLSYDQYIHDDFWSDYSVTDLQSFYDNINTSLSQIQTITSENTQIIYGNNPFPPSTVATLKDIQEGRGCQYLTTYICSTGEELGLRFINANKQKFISGYPDIISVDKSNEPELREFLNALPYHDNMIVSFREEDEIYDVYSSVINTSISTVSLSIQYFLQNYLIIGGVLFAVYIVLAEVYNWRKIFTRIQLMNLLLTMIPEEKLQEDATLHMVRQLHRM